MTDQFVTLTDGPHQGWTVQLGYVPWHFEIISQTLTAHHPRDLLDGSPLRINLSLTIAPDDPQWPMLAAAELRGLSPRPGDQQNNAAALAGVLARVHTAVGAATRADRWEITGESRLGVAGLAAIAHNAAGAHTTIAVHASVTHPDTYLDAQKYRILERVRDAGHSPQQRRAALDCVLAQVPALPGMPPPGTDWRAQAAAFSDANQPRIGAVVVCFTNAINGRSQRYSCSDLDEARRVLAGTDPPYNNTRIQVFRTVAIVDGCQRVEELDAAAVRAGTGCVPDQAALPAAGRAFPALDVAAGASVAPSLACAAPTAPAPQRRSR